ncbi:LOW QUALITY PROTEIN: hypothetical protein CRUP_022735 [Coryphaenoides rupestris]|nr:LOW QUALITY PROTEIN: hypothetical protein CRUP_022735 [Coryphaenoides rupestris]
MTPGMLHNVHMTCDIPPSVSLFRVTRDEQSNRSENIQVLASSSSPMMGTEDSISIWNKSLRAGSSASRHRYSSSFCNSVGNNNTALRDLLHQRTGKSIFAKPGSRRWSHPTMSMFSKATSSIVRQIEDDGSLIHVTRLNDSHKLVPTAVVAKRNRFWFWQKPKYRPSDFTLGDLLLGDATLDPEDGEIHLCEAGLPPLVPVLVVTHVSSCDFL